MELEPKFMDLKFGVLKMQKLINNSLSAQEEEIANNVSNSYKLIFTLRFSSLHQNVDEILEEIDRVEPSLLEWGFVEVPNI